MKILFVSHSFYPATYYGGPIYSTYNLAYEVSKIGIEVRVSTTDINGNNRLKVIKNKYIKLAENLFIKYYSSLFKFSFSIKMFTSLWKDILKADVVYLISIFSIHSPYTILFSFLFRKPIILSPRGQLGEWPLEQNKILKKLWINIFIRPFTNHIIWHSTSKQESKETRKQFPEASIIEIPNGIKIIYNNVPTNKSPEYFAKYFPNLRSSSHVIVSLARIHKKKGYDLLVEAFRIIKTINPDIYLLIAGEDFGEKKVLNEMISQYGLNEQIRIIDHISDEKEKFELLAKADVFALASHNENFGMVYAEALAAGTPVVASKNTPWEELEEYNCGKWVENTPQHFAKAIIEVLNSDVKELGINGQRLITEKYNWSIIADKFVKEIEKIIKHDE
jgi:glycosyltransferase involved in cell wall biosynthesis